MVVCAFATMSDLIASALTFIYSPAIPAFVFNKLGASDLPGKSQLRSSDAILSKPALTNALNGRETRNWPVSLHNTQNHFDTTTGFTRSYSGFFHNSL